MEIFRFDALSGTVLEILPTDLRGVVESFDEALRSEIAKPITVAEIEWLAGTHREFTVFHSYDVGFECQPWKVNDDDDLCKCTGYYIYQCDGSMHLKQSKGKNSINHVANMVFGGQSVFFINRLACDTFIVDLRSYSLVVRKRMTDIGLLPKVGDLTLDFLGKVTTRFQPNRIFLGMYLRQNVEIFGLCSDIPRSHQQGWLVDTPEVLNEKSEKYRRALMEMIGEM